jgi:hypothetical protein
MRSWPVATRVSAWCSLGLHAGARRVAPGGCCLLAAVPRLRGAGGEAPPGQRCAAIWSREGQPTALTPSVRDGNWFAAASNALAGAVHHHPSVASGGSGAPWRARADAVRPARDHLRVLRRADLQCAGDGCSSAHSRFSSWHPQPRTSRHCRCRSVSAEGPGLAGCGGQRARAGTRPRARRRGPQAVTA